MIQHVTREIQPSQLAQCIEFYALLGFERVPEPRSLAGAAVWIELGGTQIHLQTRDDAREQSGHVGVVVHPYDDVLKRLRACGHAVDPRTEHWGSPRAYVRDPAGNLVEVMARSPRATEQAAP
jgi:catechol 2,3-dioxygenase-like lactoylglutathione lyase family enzyme